MEIREANAKDIKQLVPILLQVVNLHYQKRPDIFKKKDKLQVEQSLIETLKNEEKKVIVIELDKKVCGVLIYKIKEVKDHINLKNSNTLWIEEIGVDEKCRRKGIGKLLINQAIKIAKNLNCERVELNCWEFNEDAIQFYQKQNMKIQRRIIEIEIGGK